MLDTPTITPTARRRLARAARLGTDLLDAFTLGQTGRALEQRFIASAPADIEATPRGHTARCWGIQTPPCRSATAAVLTWARMASGPGGAA